MPGNEEKKKKKNRRKRQVAEGMGAVTISDDGARPQSKRDKPAGFKPKPMEPETAENLHFEDPFWDEQEDARGQEEIVDERKMDLSGNPKDDQEGDEEADGAGKPQMGKRVWRPGLDPLKQGEELQYDSTAYLTFHRLTVEWPCLTFDTLADARGQFRTKFPLQFYIACGTQADEPQNNKVMLLKLSEIHKTKYDGVEDPEDVSDDDADDLDEDPLMDEQSFKHDGGVNRLRSMPQSPNVLATWSDTGNVHIWDAKEHLQALDTPPLLPPPKSMVPRHTFMGHSMEGFALDWSRVSQGNLITGDCSKHIFNWTPAPGGSWKVDSTPFSGHSSSVEDLQWSPNEATVFASCSVDKTVRIWDTREKRKSMIWVAAHNTDVNVISWNRKVSHLLASGADDGGVKIWDLRNFKSSSPAACFQWHTGAITSLEWHPTDEAVLAASGADDQVTVWDMSIEDDPDAPQHQKKLVGVDIPAQLLFVHQGQKQVKELHFHPQIPGLIVSTAQDGLNVFKPANID